MLSILIPTYNNACTPLVQALLKQADGIDLEIIVAEDGTTDAVALASNRWIAEMPYCRYLPLTENHGRAGIRNLLAREAKGERLLFLDDDVMPAREDFLLSYYKSTAPVVCGGILAAKGDHRDSLRWRWEKGWTEKHPAARRNLHPYDNFATANFMVRREIMLAHPFDENIKQYGYEDALFGVHLKECGVEILHIDAPVHHNGLESNALFITKTEQALASLRHLPQMQPHAAVARAERRTRYVLPLLQFMRPFLRRALTRCRMPVAMLQLYKLLYFHNLSIKPSFFMFKHC